MRDRNHSPPRRLRRGGYTLVELVLVIAILAIVAAFAAPRFFSQQAFDERGYADALAGTLRAAQKAAVATGCNAQFQLDGTGYRARLQAASGNACDPTDTTYPVPVLTGDGSAVQGSPPSAAAATPASATVTFLPSGATQSASPTTLSVGAWQIATDPTTGFVSVTRP